MKCMCGQTRPRFILSSERVLGGMDSEPMLTPREKSPKNFSSEEDRTQEAAASTTHTTNELFRNLGHNPCLTVNRKYRSGEELFSLSILLMWTSFYTSKRDEQPVETYTKGRHSSTLTFLLTGQLADGGRPNFLIHGR